MSVPVALESHEGEGTGWIHGGAHFLRGIVKVHPPLGVSNAVIQRSVQPWVDGQFGLSGSHDEAGRLGWERCLIHVHTRASSMLWKPRYSLAVLLTERWQSAQQLKMPLFVLSELRRVEEETSLA